ncbi:cupin domain-containing protein [Streptomyces flavidovirens]|uniref:cupin domain-containing protein n=1 Tax=Streptomyces flavidovirens TaxID=67298 RepID=UPI003444C796
MTHAARSAYGPVVPFLPTETDPCGVILNEADFSRSAVPDAPFKSARFTLPAGSSTPPDAHDESEVWFVVAGGGSVAVDGVRRPVTAGDMVSFGPRQRHVAAADAGEDLVVLSMWWGGPDDR